MYVYIEELLQALGVPVARMCCTHALNASQNGIHAPGGIRTWNSSKLAAADPSLRTRSHREQMRWGIAAHILWTRLWVACGYGLSSRLRRSFARKEAHTIGGRPAPELRLAAGRGERFLNLPGIESVREVYGLVTVQTELSLLFWSLCDNAATNES
jgi:hypothetical protein